jgi:Mu-like prophage major head subunit gpT
MSLMNRSSFRKQLQEGLNAVFGLAYKRYPEEWREIFDVYKSTKSFEEDVLMTGLGGAQVKAEGAGVAYDAGSEAWVARYLHETIALAFAITEEALEDNLYGDVGAKYARALARSMQHTKEVKGAKILNDGFTAGVTYGDGKVLFATDHPLQGGGTLSNTFAVAADLAEASLEDAIIQIAGWTDDRGIPIAAQAMKLIIPPALHFVAERLLATNQRPGTADNDVNALKSTGMLPQGYAVVHRLTDPDQWTLKTDVPDGLKYFQRRPLQRGMEGDFESGNTRYKARERYSFGVTDPRAAFSSPGA